LSRATRRFAVTTGINSRQGDSGGLLAIFALRKLPDRFARETKPPPMTRQLDLFGESEPSLPGLDEPAAVYRADPDEVRAELLRVLAQARAAQTFPWDARRTRYWRTVFPQMTNWLPDEEGAQLRFEFEAEIRRLEAA
jgi:hypothetical protein